MPPPPRPRPHKAVTFCQCRPSPRPRRDLRYYSDPGKAPPAYGRKLPTDSTDSDLKYYSEPDDRHYFEIDYEFLKELKRIARHNCPTCRRKKRDTKREKHKERRSKTKEAYVYCAGRYHSEMEHCRACCKICNRSTDTLDSIDDDYSLVSRSYSKPRSKSISKRQRKNSVQSNKSVSFLESSNDESLKDEPNYTAKSFTNDLKRFLLKPTPPRMSLRDKFITSFKNEIEATRKSPKLKAIKGLWKSY